MGARREEGGMRIRAYGADLFHKATERIERHPHGGVPDRSILLDGSASGWRRRPRCPAPPAGSCGFAWLELFQQSFGFFEAWESLLGLAKFTRMDPPPHAMVVHAVAQVQHFMEHHVFERQRRRRRMVENPADDDGVVGWVEVAQDLARRPPAPAQQRPPQQTLEMLAVQALEDFFEVMVCALRSG